MQCQMIRTWKWSATLVTFEWFCTSMLPHMSRQFIAPGKTPATSDPAAAVRFLASVRSLMRLQMWWFCVRLATVWLARLSFNESFSSSYLDSCTCERVSCPSRRLVGVVDESFVAEPNVELGQVIIKPSSYQTCRHWVRNGRRYWLFISDWVVILDKVFNRCSIRLHWRIIVLGDYWYPRLIIHYGSIWIRLCFVYRRRKYLIHVWFYFLELITCVDAVQNFFHEWQWWACSVHL